MKVSGWKLSIVRQNDCIFYLAFFHGSIIGETPFLVLSVLLTTYIDLKAAFLGLNLIYLQYSEWNNFSPMTLQTYIREVPVLIPAGTPAVLTEVSPGFPHLFQENGGLWGVRLPALIGIEVLTAGDMKYSLLWGITPCSPLKVNRRFGVTSRQFSVLIIIQVSN
jgi:hypothetical protein